MLEVTTPQGTAIHVIDAQVHLNLLGVRQGLAAMDALGVDRVIFDEFWGWDKNSVRLPHFRLPGGAVRHIYPMAEEAAMRFPHRIGTVAWVDRHDPDIEGTVSRIAETPHQLCIRTPIRFELGEELALTAGEYDRLFAAAERNRVPVMIALPRLHVPARIGYLVPVFRNFPSLQFIVDHCGVLPLSEEDVGLGFRDPRSLESFAELARYPNVAMKWHVAPLLSQEPFPFTDLFPYLRLFLAEFGPRRLMWASDCTHTGGHHTWADSLNYLLWSDQIAEEEKVWLLGGTAKTLLKWPSINDPAYGWSSRLNGSNEMIIEP